MGLITTTDQYGRKQTLGETDDFLVYMGRELRRDTVYVVCPFGIGDTLYVGTLLGNWRKLYAKGKKICMVVKQGHSQIPDWFEAVDEKIVSDEMVCDCRIFSVHFGVWKLKNYLYGHFHTDNTGKLLSEYQECEIKNMIYRYKKLVLNIPAQAFMEEPKILPDLKAWNELTEKYDIGKQTAIIMPYAQSVGLLETSFWERLVLLLKGMGYRVLTNVKGTEEAAIKGTQSICADIATTAAICEQCGLVIAYRSGICDVLAYTDTNLVVINSSEYHLHEWDLKTAVNRSNIYNYLVGRDNILQEIYFILNSSNSSE